jgi:hypothetical protein
MDEEGRPASEEMKAHADHHRRLWNGVAAMTFAWANLENAMVILLGNIIEPKLIGRFSSAIYFAVGGLDVRISIVDAAFRELLDQHQFRDQIMEKWDSLLNTIGRLKRTRNKVAHGQITTTSANGKNHVRLTAPIFHQQSSRAAFRKRQIPGISANDLEKSVQAVNQAITQLFSFSSIANLITGNQPHRLPGAIAELEALVQKQALERDNPIPPTP